tara:strand:+ start:105 stop:371 length:267 start_codon:yes stop_codon:yes gene_type:complete
VKGMANKHKINNSNSRIRKKILEFASSVESFDLHDLHDWWWEHAPKHVPPRNKLGGLLGTMDCLEKLGYDSSGGRKNMKYKLRSEYNG